MIAPLVREVWQVFQRHDEFSGHNYCTAIIDAYVEAEWQRRKAEFRLFHVTCDYWDKPTDQGGAFQTRWKCMDLERHNWTNDQWREEVIAELREP